MQANIVGGEAGSGRIGASVEELRQQLLHFGDVLADLVEPSARPLIDEATLQLRQLACRVAVVGQIKSGKSSFINAFVQHPNLLPTSVTPWTTAVTNLHFGQQAAGGHAAIFTFMRESEWRDLAESGGPVRELTERLVPGFEPQLLQRQTDLLRGRARARLGVEYERLLGQAHYFARLAPDTLQGYVCSGDYAGESGPVPIGKYSDITKSADVYCREGPFAFPSTVVDTPGTNDPFLIRDEITRRSLGSADIYIVVLTARQPLSDSDVALLRIMRGLNQDRIIVLINRIDDLADVDEELPRVGAFVRDRLEAEFPGSAIPIIYGSAWWATQAMAFDPGAVERILKRRSASYLLHAGLLHPNEIDPAVMNDPDGRERLRQSMLTMSGLPAINQTVNNLMCAAHPVYIMRQATRSFAEMAQACEGATRRDLQILMAEASNRIDNRAQPAAQPGPKAGTTELLSEIAGNIEASAKGIEAQLAAIIREERENLRAALQATIDLHAARERDVLIDTLSRGRAPGVWTHEGVALRRALAADFNQRFQMAASRLTAFYARVAPELHRLMAVLAPDTRLVDPHGEAAAIPVPAVAPLGRFMVLDLDTSSWSAFWSRQPSPEASGAKIEALIRAEFAPVADELVHLAETALHDFSKRTIRWSLGACRNILQALDRQLKHLQAQNDAARRPAPPPAAAQQAALDIAANLGNQRQRLQHNEAITKHLEHLTQYIDTVLKYEAPRVQ